MGSEKKKKNNQNTINNQKEDNNKDLNLKKKTKNNEKIQQDTKKKQTKTGKPNTNKSSTSSKRKKKRNTNTKKENIETKKNTAEETLINNKKKETNKKTEKNISSNKANDKTTSTTTKKRKRRKKKSTQTTKVTDNLKQETKQVIDKQEKLKKEEKVILTTKESKNKNIIKEETLEIITPKELTLEHINLKKEETQNKHKSPIAFTLLVILSIIIIIIFVMSFLINKNIKIKLNGNYHETIEVFSDYTDPGYNATLFKKNINKYIKTKNNLNTDKLGTYTITYKLSFFHTHQTKRTIKVIDTTPPEIKLNGDKTITMYTDEDYIEKGVTIEDNYDTDLSSNLVIESNLDINTKGTYTIKYNVKDSSNNESSITRTIIVKNKPTTIKKCNVSNQISKYICENNYKVSVGYYNLNTKETYYYNKYEQYYGASLIKTLDALYLYDKNMINDELKSHVKKIITVSNNPSHQYLVNYIGKNNLKAYGNSLGAKYTLIGGDNFGITTVSDQIVYMKKLYSMTNNNQNEELKSFFINSYYNNLLFDNCPTIMHKYGWWGQVFHNSGIVLDENPYIVTILTKEAYNDYNKIISTISKLVYDYHKTL